MFLGWNKQQRPRLGTFTGRDHHMKRQPGTVHDMHDIQHAAPTAHFAQGLARSTILVRLQSTVAAIGQQAKTVLP